MLNNIARLRYNFFIHLFKPLSGFMEATNFGNTCFFTETGDTDCIYLINKQGIYTSPSYPRYYGSTKICQWNITAPESHYIRAEFLDVHLGRSSPTKVHKHLSW